MASGPPKKIGHPTPEQSFQHNRRLVNTETNKQVYAISINTHYDYLTPYLKEWASNPLLYLTVIDYPFLTKVPMQQLCGDLVELFKENNIPVIWLMPGTGPSWAPPPKKPTTTHLVKSLIMQAMQLPEFPKQASRSIALLGETEKDLFVGLGTVLAQLENVFIVIDSTVLRSGRLSISDVCNPWIANLLRTCSNHSSMFNEDRYPPKVGVKVALVVWGREPRQLELPGPQWKDHSLYVDIAKCPSPLSWEDEIVARQTVHVTGKRQLAVIIQAYNERITGRKIKEQPPVRPHLDEANGPPSESIGLSAQEAFPTSSNSKQPLNPLFVDEADGLVEASRKTAFPTSSHSKQPSTSLSQDNVESIQIQGKTISNIYAHSSPLSYISEPINSREGTTITFFSHSSQTSLLSSQDNVTESIRIRGKAAAPIFPHSNNVNKGSVPLPTLGETSIDFVSNYSQPSVPSSQDKVVELEEISKKAAPSTSSHSSQPSVPSSWVDKIAELGGISLRSAIPTSSKTECILHKPALSVSRFELFDDYECPATEKVNRAKIWFQDLRDKLHPALPSIPQKEDRIRIAVLDTGIDMDDDFIHLKENRKRVTYKSFVTGDPNPTVRSDPAGHGTHVAGLLLRVAPNANIYVAKVSDKDGLHDPQDIANAIVHAVDEWHVHIISMSFGFEKLTKELDCIKCAIRHARSKEVVLFAAARNNGGSMEIAYPANHSDVICINSTDGDGNSSPFNPSRKEGKDFSTLGEGIVSHSDPAKCMSGTSYATPIAAGMAAAVMDYMTQKSRGWPDYETHRYEAERIKTKDGIIAVFNTHFSDRRGDFKYLLPWKFFKKGGVGFDMVLLYTLQNL